MTDILTLADARSALRLPAGDTSNDSDLTGTYIPAVTAIVEDAAGPMMSGADRTWIVDGGKTQIVLPSAVTSVVSVTETGNVLTQGTDYVVNLRAGVISRGTTRLPYIFFPGVQNVVVTYRAGAYATPADVPGNVKLAARIILRQLWQADQQGRRPQLGVPDEDTVTTPSGFAIPRRAAELLKATPNVPGFA